MAHIVLPSEILSYFSVVGVEQTSTEIHIHLDELMNPELSGDVPFESKGFMEAVSVTDFPIRNCRVILMVRPELLVRSKYLLFKSAYKHYDDILNFYDNRSSNAAAESFNSKIKLFRANLHGVGG